MKLMMVKMNYHFKKFIYIYLENNLQNMLKNTISKFKNSDIPTKIIVGTATTILAAIIIISITFFKLNYIF